MSLFDLESIRPVVGASARRLKQSLQRVADSRFADVTVFAVPQRHWKNRVTPSSSPYGSPLRLIDPCSAPSRIVIGKSCTLSIHQYDARTGIYIRNTPRCHEKRTIGCEEKVTGPVVSTHSLRGFFNAGRLPGHTATSR